MTNEENYQDTLCDWVGEIPKHWNMTRGRFLFNSKKEINRELQCKNLLSLTLSGVLNKDYQSTGGLRPENYNTYQIFQKDDLVFKMIDLENVNTSRVGLVHEEGIMSPVYIRHEPIKEKINPKFAYWFYYDLYKKEIYNSIGSGVRSSLSSSDLLEIELPVPPITEQKLISRYLEKKTSQIDLLVEKSQIKIELLKEQRTSLINHYVTKGLDPNVEMKDSGVDWIGEIPKHWEVSRIKHVHQQKTDSFIDGDWIESPYITDHGIRYITTGNIGEGVFKFQGNSFISQDTFDELKCSEVFPGDLVISRLSPPVGRSCIIPELGYRIVTSVDNVIVRLKKDLSINYYNYLFNSARSFENTSTLSRGTTLIRISRTILGNIETLIPPLDEQNEIVNYLDQCIKPIEKLEEKEHNRIKLLREYRQSLISSIVTGKIRVTEDMI